MRYIDIGGHVMPRNCKYGPRPAEGIVLNDLEWWSIADHLVKEEREKEMAAVLKAKEEAKRNISYQMTKNWSNTLASVKTQSEQKRIEKREKEKQDKIDKYNEIMKNRKEDRKKILDSVKMVMAEEKNSSRTIKSGVLLSMVVQERRDQIEKKNVLRDEEKQKDKEMGERLKAEAEEFEKDTANKKLMEKNKRKLQKEMLDKQMEVIQLRRKAMEEEREEEKQDLKNMKLEADRIHHCNMVEKSFRKEFAAKLIEKTQSQIEHEQRLALEEEEENEINKIFLEFSRKFKKNRKVKEQEALRETIERRTKMAELLAEKLAEASRSETEKLEAAETEKLQLEEERENLKKQQQQMRVAEIKDMESKVKEKLSRKRYQAKEAMKWDVIQACRSAEVNQKWRENMQKRIRDQKIKTREIYDQQCKERAEREAKDLKEWLEPEEGDAETAEEERQFIEMALNFVKKNNLPEYPVLAAVAEVNKSKASLNEKSGVTRGKEAGEKENSEKKTKPDTLGFGCYCFKY